MKKKMSVVLILMFFPSLLQADPPFLGILQQSVEEDEFVTDCFLLGFTPGSTVRFEVWHDGTRLHVGLGPDEYFVNGLNDFASFIMPQVLNKVGNPQQDAFTIKATNGNQEATANITVTAGEQENDMYVPCVSGINVWVSGDKATVGESYDVGIWGMSAGDRYDIVLEQDGITVETLISGGTADHAGTAWRTVTVPNVNAPDGYDIRVTTSGGGSEKTRVTIEESEVPQY